MSYQDKPRDYAKATTGSARYGTQDPRTDTERLLGILKSHGAINIEVDQHGTVWKVYYPNRVIKGHVYGITMDNVWEWLEANK